MNKQEVMALQRALLLDGFDPQGIDGLIGNNTRAALKGFQWANDLPQSGEPDAATLQALRLSPAPEAGGGLPIPQAWLPDCDIVGVVVHWTGGTYTPNSGDLRHYNLLLDGDCNVIRGGPSIALHPRSGVRPGYAEHTYHCNSGYIGLGICAMNGATQIPFNPGQYPLKREQMEFLPRMLAQLSRRYSIAVNGRLMLSHAEVQPTLGIKQKGKWDIDRLPYDRSIVGAVRIGDIFRAATRKLLEA